MYFLDIVFKHWVTFVNMRLHVVILRKSFPTKLAHVILPLFMNAVYMSFQITLLGERLFTKLASTVLRLFMNISMAILTTRQCCLCYGELQQA